jgi:hypothetical protein
VTIGSDSYLMLTIPAAGGGAVQVAVSQVRTTNTLILLGVLLAARSPDTMSRLRPHGWPGCGTPCGKRRRWPPGYPPRDG